MELLSLRLKEIGIEVDCVVDRLGGNELLYLDICRKFLKDQNYTLFIKAMSDHDLESGIVYIHTLKGVAANLGFRNLELISKGILNSLKTGDNMNLIETTEALSDEYDKIIEILK